MPQYKQAGELVPGDVYISRGSHQRRRDQTYRVTGIRPGHASTIINVSVESMDGNKFFSIAAIASDGGFKGLTRVRDRGGG